MRNVAELTTEELLRTIQLSSAELAKRANGEATQQVPKPKLPEVDAPDEDDQEFILRLKTKALRGEYISASERNRVADISENYSAWVRRQGLPTERGTGAWRKLAAYARTPAAKPR